MNSAKTAGVSPRPSRLMDKASTAKVGMVAPMLRICTAASPIRRKQRPCQQYAERHAEQDRRAAREGDQLDMLLAEIGDVLPSLQQAGQEPAAPGPGPEQENAEMGRVPAHLRDHAGRQDVSHPDRSLRADG